MNHPQVPLGEVADFVNGAAFKPEDWGEDGLPIIRIQNLTDPGKPFNYTERIVAEKLVIDPGDLLVSWSATLGVFQWNGPKGLLNQHIFRVLPNNQVVDKNYLKHTLGKAINDMERHLHGATMKHVNRGEFLGTRIPLPPLEEQRRIAAILDQAQCIRAKAARRTDLLLALGRSLFIRRFGLPSENPYQLPLFKLIDICNPKQWPTISSKQLQDNGYPVFGANGLIGYFDSFNHSEPTVLVTCRGATCGTVNISPPNCYVTGNSMAMDNPNQDLLTTEYLAWVLRLRGMNDVISGSAQPQITRQGLEAVTIPVPSIEAQNDFAKELSAVTCVTATSRLSENSICGVADSLSARLFESSRK